jgi:hypothetical protein
VQNYIEPKSSIHLGDLASGFKFGMVFSCYFAKQPGLNGRTSVNMTPRNEIQKTNCHYFAILSKCYFIYFLPMSLLYQDMEVPAMNNLPNRVVLPRWVDGPCN